MLLLDEPLGALDLKLRKGLQIELKQIQREVGITFVYVTHDQEEALTMSDRIAVMNRGRVEQVCAPGGGLRAADDQLRRRLHRRLQPDAGDGLGAGVVKLDCGPEVARRHRELGPAKAAPRWCGRRSCGSSWSADAPARPTSPSVEGVVESSVYLGTATQLVVGVGGEVRMTVLVPNADESERQTLPGGGARVVLSWEPQHMHVVIDPKDEEERDDDAVSGMETTTEDEARAGGAWPWRAVVRPGAGGAGAGDRAWEAAAAASKAAAAQEAERVKLESKPSGT